MATSKGITNVQALTSLIAFAEANGCENTEAIAKMRKHLAVMSKPKAQSDTPSKTARLNANLKEKVAAFLEAEGSVTAKGIAERAGIPEVQSSQKATILMALLVSEGRAVRHSEKGRVWWVPASK